MEGQQRIVGTTNKIIFASTVLEMRKKFQQDTPKPESKVPAWLDRWLGQRILNSKNLFFLKLCIVKMYSLQL